MSNTLKVKHGTEATLTSTTLEFGEFGFTTDTNKLFINNGSEALG